MYSLTTFGAQKAVFANQDDGIFSAIPITFDETVLTLETYTAGSRKFVKAGSVVKSGNTVKGITAEEYEITNGPVTGRVVLEGYVYVDRLTAGAATAMSALPKIVPIPYGKIIFERLESAENAVYLKVYGSVWTDTVAAANFTLTDTDTTNMVIDEVEKDSEDESVIKITFEVDTGKTAADGKLNITAVASAAVVGASGKVISGLPITVEFKDEEVCG